MTDEEKLAEGYYNSKFKSNESHFSKFDIKQAFLAGLKARPQWHDLRKAPNDLPKEHISVLVMLEQGVPYISFVSTDKRWFCTNYYTGEDKVIAWCEIEPYKEIENEKEVPCDTRFADFVKSLTGE